MNTAEGDSTFQRIAKLSANALTPDGGVDSVEFLAACSEVLPIVGELVSHSNYQALVLHHVGYEVHAIGILQYWRRSTAHRACRHTAYRRQVSSTSHIRRATSACAEKLGTAFAMVRSDVGGNIDRLETRRATDPDKFGLLFNIVLAEVEAGQEGGSLSATKGLLWLKRCAYCPRRQRWRTCAWISGQLAISVTPGAHHWRNPCKGLGALQRGMRHSQERLDEGSCNGGLCWTIK